MAPLDAALRGVVDDPLEVQRWTRRVDGAGGEPLAESALQLSGLHCAACSGLIETALSAVPGVLEARVSAAAQRASVRWNPALTQASALINAVRRAGYDAVPDAAAPARALRRVEMRRALWRLFVAAFCAMQVMMFATPVYLAEPGDMAPDLRMLLHWGSWVLTLPVVAFCAGPFFCGAWRAMRAGQVSMDLPVALGIAVTFVASTGAAFDPGGPFGHEVWFDSLTMFVAFLLGARWVELRARHRAAEHLEGALARLPETAQRLTDDGRVETVGVQRLVPGDRVRVGLGDAFPADGILLAGVTQVDESLLTGESHAVSRRPGDSVVGGSVNTGVPAEMRVERVGDDTRHAAIVALMRDALTRRPAALRLADRWAGPFLLAVIALAAASAAVWSVVDPSRALAVAVAVLIVTCPCALSLATPATLVAAAGGLARRGVLFQRLDALEALARVDHVFFDKTGTLTEERPAFADLLPLRPAGPGEVADWTARAASLAAWSRHPLAQAVAAAAAVAVDDRHLVWTGLEERPGQGLLGTDVQGEVWRLGSAGFTGACPRDDAALYLARDGVPLAALRLRERLRDGAAETVAALLRAGLRVTLLSGDTPARAVALAARLGIDDVLGGATPERKLRAVAEAQHAGRTVAMVGDGVNDAPVLARADVSLAMGQGALVSRAQADAIVVSSRPADVLHARDVARRTLRIARQNLAWAALYNAACVPLAVMGALPPWAAGLGMAASSAAVILNALRAGR